MQSLQTNIGAVKDLLSEGKFYELGHALKQGMTHHPNHPPFMFSLSRQHGDTIKACFSSANDIFTMGGHTGTHIDALGHVSDDGKIYGGLDAHEIQHVTHGLSVHDVCALTPIMARGRLLDVARFKGKEFLEESYPVTAADLKGTAESQGTKIEKGDVVLVRTGWTRVFDDHARYGAHQESPPGVTLDGAQWLLDQGMRATGNDTGVYELRVEGLPVHRLLLKQHGVPIMENMNLESVATDQVYTFLFLAIPMRIVGGTGSPIRPLAVV